METLSETIVDVSQAENVATNKKKKFSIWSLARKSLRKSKKTTESAGNVPVAAH